MKNLRHFAPVVLLCATAAGSSLTVQISTEIAPSGGWAQIKVTLPAPQLITKGELVVKLDPTIFATTAAVATFSAEGDAWGSASITNQQVDVQFTSPSGGIGRLPSLPILTLTVPVLSTAATGTISAVTADASKSSWLDASGNSYAVSVTPGSVTIGGSVSIQNLSPGGGLLPAGTVVKINGTGFTPSTPVEIDGVSISKTQFVSAQEIDFTLGGAAELTGKRVVVGDVQYFSAMPSAPDKPAKAPLIANQYMLPLQTFISAGHSFPEVGDGTFILQNPNLTPVTVYFESPNPVPTALSPVTIPAGEMYAYSTGEDLNLCCNILAVASQPIRMLANWFNPTVGFLQVQGWSVTPAQPSRQTFTASPVSFTWQMGTAAPAPIVVTLSDGFVSPFTLLATGAPFSVTPTQGTTAQNGINITVGVDTTGLSVGTYSGSISVTPVGPNVTTTTIPMTLNVTGSPFIGVNRPSLVEVFSAKNPPLVPETIKVTSLGKATTFAASSIVPWMTVSPTSGSTPGTISVSFDITGLAVGMYHGQILITGPSNSVTVPVQMSIGSDQNTIAAESIAFSAQTGGAAPASQSIVNAFCGQGCTQTGPPTVTSSGGSWLSAVVQGTNNQNAVIVVSANPTGLKAGTYTGTINVSAPNSVAVQWPVSLVVYDTLPPLTATPASLTISGPADNLPPQTITVQSGGVPISVTWSASAGLIARPAASFPAPAPTSLQTPAPLQIIASALPGVYQGTVSINGGGQTLNVPVTINVTPASDLPPYIGSIVNAASQTQGSISPGEIITIYGYSVGPAETSGFAVDSSGKVVKSLQGATVLFDGNPAPLIYGSSSQLNVMVPYEIAGEVSTVISLNYGGVASTAWAVPVATSAPAIFTIAGDGVGPGAVLNQDNSVNSASNPAARGSIIQIYATGEGQTLPAGVTGSVTQSNTKMPLLPVTVSIGGINAVVQYAGSAPESVTGLLQVNAVVPQGTATGPAVPITVSVGGQPSQTGVTIAVK